MRKIIGAINMTLDGVFDHTAVDPDDEVHDHYSALLDSAGVILYGRTTYQLMQYWQELLQNPSGEKSMNDFARAIDQVPKIVFSHTMKETGWNTASLAQRPLEEMVGQLRIEPGKDIFVGSRSLIIQLINAPLLDELQLCIHPILAVSGPLLFEGLTGRTMLQLKKTKTFKAGAIVFYYKPVSNLDRGLD
jgi:dihydrofolate reductase